MQTAKLSSANEDRTLFEEGRFSRSEVLHQLDRIVTSKHFRNSKRYPSFLRFVVEQTLAGKTEELKERTLGVDVFARPNDYDTNADPIVRVTAGEIRKRIAQYYQEAGHEAELRIDLPLGSYIPHFLPANSSNHSGDHDPLTGLRAVSTEGTPSLDHEVVGPETAVLASTEPVVVKKRLKRAIIVALECLIISAVLLGAVLLRNSLKDQGIKYFWQPMLASGKPVLIVIGVHSLDERGQDQPVSTRPNPPRDGQDMLTSMIRYDMVPVSDIVSYSELTDLLAQRSILYRTKGSSDTTFEDLRQGSVILIGGLDNVWTKRLAAPLRYRFFAANQLESEIRDNKDPSHVWKFDNMQMVTGDSRDYAIVASYLDPTIGQHVIVAAGIGKAGTQAAAEFLTSDSELRSWLAEAKVPRGKNVELVLSTEILDGQPGPPHVVASSIW